VCSFRPCVVIGCTYVIADLIIFVFLYMLSVYWGICNKYVTERSRSYPQMLNWWQLGGMLNDLLLGHETWFIVCRV
jgi:hypothetical protein